VAPLGQATHVFPTDTKPADVHEESQAYKSVAQTIQVVPLLKNPELEQVD